MDFCSQEAAIIIRVLNPQLPVLDASEFIELLDPVGEAEEDEASVTPRSRKSIDPRAANDPQPLLVEEEPPRRS